MLKLDIQYVEIVQKIFSTGNSAFPLEELTSVKHQTSCTIYLRFAFLQQFHKQPVLKITWQGKVKQSTAATYPEINTAQIQNNSKYISSVSLLFIHHQTTIDNPLSAEDRIKHSKWFWVMEQWKRLGLNKHIFFELKDEELFFYISYLPFNPCN